MFPSQNWTSTNNHSQNYGHRNDQPQPYFQVTTNQVSYEFFPQNGENRNFNGLENGIDRSYSYTSASYPIYPPSAYSISGSETQEESKNSFSVDEVKEETENIVKISKNDGKKRRKKKAESRVLALKESICKKHNSHATLEEFRKCEEQRAKNRAASRRSRLKKVTTIEVQKAEIDRLNMLVRHKDAQINQILHQHGILTNRLRYIENQLRIMSSQQNFAQACQYPSRPMLAPPAPSYRLQIDQMPQKTQFWTTSGQMPRVEAQNSDLMEADSFIDKILEDMNKMAVVEPGIQNALEISTPILKQAIQHVFKTPPIQQTHQTPQVDEDKAESEVEFVEETNKNDEFAPRPTLLNLDDNGPDPIQVTVKETVVNSPIFRMKINTVTSISPTRYMTTNF